MKCACACTTKKCVCTCTFHLSPILRTESITSQIMSSSSAPEDAPDDALPPYENFDGGSSKKLTQGEIILVTVLSFVVVVTAFVVSYMIYVRRARKWRPLMESKAEPRSSSNGQLVATEIPLAINCEAAAGGGGTTTDRLRTTDDAAEDGGPSRNQDDGDRQSRRRSSASDASNNEMRPTVSRNRSERRRGSNASDASNNEMRPTVSRKSSIGSIGTNVSSHYKLAAIEHMNQLSQAGR